MELRSVGAVLLGIAIATLLFRRKREALERDAERWRAFIGCQRIRILGSAGFSQDSGSLYRHLGIEVWTEHPCRTESDEASRLLTEFADAARSVAEINATPGPARDE